jgi:hypothetical protein
VIASRTHTFLQFARYHPNTIEFFDIGNHLELAGRILARPQFNALERMLTFNVETNRATYLAANGDMREGETPAVTARESPGSFDGMVGNLSEGRATRAKSTSTLLLSTGVPDRLGNRGKPRTRGLRRRRLG